MKFKRFISLLLVCCTVFAAITVAGCSNKDSGGQKDNDSGKVSDSESEEVTDPRLLIPDNLPEDKDYGGRKFRISTRPEYIDEIWIAAEDATDIVDDALLKRNAAVENRFGVEIVAVESVGEEIDDVMKVINSGDDAYDLVSAIVQFAGTFITSGMVYNWDSIDYIDFSKPWWINGINDKFRIGNAIYTAVGDTCLSTLWLTEVIFFNIKQAERWQMPNLFDVVRDQGWTIEYFESLVKDIWEDLDASTTASAGDFYGLQFDFFTANDQWPMAFDIPIIDKDEEGLPVCNLGDEKLVEALDKVNSLLYSKGVYGHKNYGESSEPLFTNDMTVFGSGIIWAMYKEMRSLDFQYGVLPFPKFDENQESYKGGAMDRFSVLCVPKTVKEEDLEMVGIITEALNAESYRILYPAYYEDTLQSKYLRVDDNAEMLDIIAGGRNFDMNTLFTNQLGIAFVFRDLVRSNSNALPGKWKALEKSVNKSLENIIEAYEDNAE